jgi:hypothetical protein
LLVGSYSLGFQGFFLLLLLFFLMNKQIFNTKRTLYNPYTPSQVWNITAPHNSY